MNLGDDHSKDYVPAAVQVAIVNVAGLKLSSASDGLIQITLVDASNALQVTTGVGFAGLPVCRRQPIDGRSPQHHCYGLVGRHELDPALAVLVVASTVNDAIHWQASPLLANGRLG